MPPMKRFAFPIPVRLALVMLLGIFGLMTWQLWPYFSGLMR